MYADHLAALQDHAPPLAYVDLDAFEANGRRLVAQAGPLPVRVASKSLRCTALIHHALGLDARVQGVMAFTVREALHVAGSGVSDVLIGYPSVDRDGLVALARFVAEHPGHVIRPMVDDLAQVALVGEAAQAAGVELAVCVDVDTSFRPFGARRRGPVIGARRSPLRAPGDVAAFVARASDAAGVRVDALMAYDAQIAGVGDAPPGRPVRARAIRQMQARSAAELHDRIPRVVEAVRRVLAQRGGALELVNLGGTGSLERMRDLAGATELTAGSGFYAPTLFDAYRHLQLEPAAAFVLPVVRRPGRDVATLLGGGYHASGAAGPDRLPSPAWPPGLRLDANEGAGEVQTPVLGPAAATLGVGDRVVLRHAKAGELCERFDRLHLIRGGVVERTVPTYRGEGLTFL